MGTDDAEAEAAKARLNDIMQARFLAMFGDDQGASGSAGKKKPNGKRGRAVEAAVEAAREEATAAERLARKKAKRDASCRPASENVLRSSEEDGGVRAAKATSRATLSDRPSRDGGAAGKANRMMHTTSGASPPASEEVRSVPTVVFGGDRPMLAASVNVGRSALPSVGSNGGARARRLFMSDRVDKVHEVASHAVRRAATATAGKKGAPGAPSTTADGEPMGEVVGLTGASLNDMRREVQRFGAQGLSKWDRKALEAKRRADLGAKAEKGPRIPANIGIGLWRKNEEREEKKRVEEFEAGGRLMKKKRGLRKADTPDGKASSGDKERGLAWGAGNFKGGVLTLRKSDLVKEDKRLNTKISLGGGKLAGREYTPGSKKKHGGKGGKKAGRPSGGGKKRR